jgi:hypothetical protein
MKYRIFSRHVEHETPYQQSPEYVNNYVYIVHSMKRRISRVQNM